MIKSAETMRTMRRIAVTCAYFPQPGETCQLSINKATDSATLPFNRSSNKKGWTLSAQPSFIVPKEQVSRKIRLLRNSRHQCGHGFEDFAGSLKIPLVTL